jgi:DNA-binding XRE family transcriptional regulator
MTRQEKKNYVVKEDGGNFVLDDEKEKIKFKVMQEFVKIRKEKGVTQDELAKRTGIARPNIARMENGSYNPTIEMMVRMAAGLDMRLDIRWVDKV